LHFRAWAQADRLGADAFESVRDEHPGAALTLLNNFCKMFSERLHSANTIISEIEQLSTRHPQRLLIVDANQ
jgi:hypothetical protein